MKRIAEGLHAYDHAGACPKCGRSMRPIELIHAHVTVSRGETVGDKTYYTTRYSDISPRTIGFCDFCCQEEYEANAKVRPSASGWLKELAVALAAIGGIVAVSRAELEENTSTLLTGVAFLVLIYGLFHFRRELSGFLKQRRIYVRQKTGTGEPYTPWSAETVADALTKALTKSMNGEAYLTPEAFTKTKERNAARG